MEASLPDKTDDTELSDAESIEEFFLSFPHAPKRQAETKTDMSTTKIFFIVFLAFKRIYSLNNY